MPYVNLDLGLNKLGQIVDSDGESLTMQKSRTIPAQMARGWQLYHRTVDARSK